MIRVLDFFLSLFGLLFLFPVLCIISLIGFFDTGSPFFRQRRVGQSQQTFILLKFRTMSKNTEHMSSHLVDPSNITKFGSFLRRSKLDELPQLWNVLKGEMSLVGPRPGLPSQTKLREERNKLKVFSVRPGVTGLAQINKIDMSTPELLAETDAKMIKHLDLKSYFKYIFLTVLGNGSGDRVKKVD